jgi:CheY-like chemotaxis protein
MAKQNAVVFDDDDLFLTLFTRIFKANGLKVTSYANPRLYLCSQPGVEKCPVEERCTDFLLTDFKMPGMTGLEFLRRVKQLSCKIPTSRKAIISGNWMDEDLKEARSLGIRVFHKSDAKKYISEWVME